MEEEKNWHKETGACVANCSKCRKNLYWEYIIFNCCSHVSIIQISDQFTSRIHAAVATHLILIKVRMKCCLHDNVLFGI